MQVDNSIASIHLEPLERSHLIPLRRSLALLPCLAIALLAPSAYANTISGTAYCSISSADASNTPAPGQTHTGTACATFTSSDINFSNSTGNTIGGFITSGNLISSVSYLNGYTAASSLDQSLFLFTGTGYFTIGQTYTATHDDGTVMMVGTTTVISSPGLTSPLTSSFVWANPSGNYSFQYDYTENQGGSTYVTNATVSPVPEPTSLALCGTGVLALAGLYRRRSSAARALAGISL